jgi:hypothetical protein
MVVDDHHHEHALCVLIPGCHPTEEVTIVHEAAHLQIIGAVLELLPFKIEDMARVPVLTVGAGPPLVDPRREERAGLDPLPHRGGHGPHIARVGRVTCPEVEAARDEPERQPPGSKTLEQ